MEGKCIMKKRIIPLLIILALTVTGTLNIARAQTGFAAPAGAMPGGDFGRGGGGGGFGGMGGFGMGQTAPAGPPAPVPREVAIQRPTADEAEKLNAELKRFIDTDTSANKDLLKKYSSLLTVQVPRANPAIALPNTMWIN
jgi:hypothetical protein